MLRRIFKPIFLFLFTLILLTALFSCENKTNTSNESSDESSEESKTTVSIPVIIKPVQVSIGCSYNVDVTAGERYPDDGIKLSDGVHSDDISFFDSAYVGWNAGPPTITVDLGQNYDTIKRFELGYLCTNVAGILPPTTIVVEGSTDGQNFVKIGELTKPQEIMSAPQVAILELNSYTTARYIRFLVGSNKHWVFVDEVVVIADVESSGVQITSIVLKKENNPTLDRDITFTVDNRTNRISNNIPFISKAGQQLFFTIEHNGDGVYDAVGELTDTKGFIVGGKNELKLKLGDHETVYKLNLSEYYGLPVVILTTTDKAVISKNDDYTLGSVSVLSADGISNYDLSMGIRVRGNSTRSHPKLAYRIKLDKKADILGMGKAKNWVLLANHSDKSLLRNVTAFKLAKMFDNLKFTPAAEPCEVYLNGEYIGVYTIGHHLEVHEERVDITEGGTDVDTGYFIECDVRAAEEGRAYFEVSGMLFSILSPKPVTDEQYKSIKGLFTEIDTMLRYKDETVWQLLDMASCIDWLIAKEICGATGMGYDAYMYKDVGEKLKFGPVWDYDLAFGNADFGGADRYDRFYLGGQWMALWMQYDSFRTEFFKVWDKAKSDYIPRMIEGLWEDYEYLKYAAELNFKRWKILDQYVWPNPELVMAANTYKKQIEHVEWYIRNHTEWMDNEYARLYGYKR